MIRTLYAVVDKDGHWVRGPGRGRLRVYEKRATAERYAVWDGDSVVELNWDSDRQPLFIRTKLVRPGP